MKGKAFVFACMAAFLIVQLPLAAEDLNPPPWRGQLRTTMAYWQFQTPSPSPPPDLVFNPYGMPGSLVTPKGGDFYRPVWGGRNGVWPLSGEFRGFIPNNPGGGISKDIWVQITWAPQETNAKPEVVEYTTMTPGIPLGDTPLGPTGEVAPADTWYFSIFSIHLEPNPTSEIVKISGLINIDEVVIDTICIDGGFGTQAPTEPPTPPPTMNSTSTPTKPPSFTPTATQTLLPSFTSTATKPPTFTPTRTPTMLPTFTSSPTSPLPPTKTPTRTPTATSTLLPSFTSTPTPVDDTPTSTPTWWPTLTPMPTVACPEMPLTFGGYYRAEPTVSPDGMWVAYRRADSQGHTQIYKMPATGGPEIKVTSEPTDHMSPCWSPDGTMIVFSKYSLVGGYSQISGVNAGGGAEYTLTSGSYDSSAPVWSPSGDWIAYEKVDATGFSQIYKITPFGASETALTTDRSHHRLPEWSPASDQIAYQKWDATGTFQIYVIPAAGGPELPLTSDGYAHRNPKWSPDGNWIAYRKKDATGFWQIYGVPALGGAETPITISPFDKYRPQWSQDSQWIAFYGLGSGGFFQIYHVQVGVGSEVELTDDLDDHAWPDMAPLFGQIIYSRYVAGRKLHLYSVSVYPCYPTPTYPVMPTPEPTFTVTPTLPPTPNVTPTLPPLPPTPTQPPDTVIVGFNDDIHMDYMGQANDFHVQGIVKSAGGAPPVVSNVVVYGQMGTGTWTETNRKLTPLGGDDWLFEADFVTTFMIYNCQWMHFGIEFYVNTWNVIANLSGYWTLGGTPLSPGNVAVTGFWVDDAGNIRPGFETLRITNDSTVPVQLNGIDLAQNEFRIPLQRMNPPDLGRLGEGSPFYPVLSWTPVPGFPISLNSGQFFDIQLEDMGINLVPGSVLLIRGQQLMQGAPMGDWGWFYEQHQTPPS